MAGKGRCVVCDDTGLIRKDGKVVSSEYARMSDIMRDHNPCWVCDLGEKEKILWNEWTSEMAKPLLSREVNGR